MTKKRSNWAAAQVNISRKRALKYLHMDEVVPPAAIGCKSIGRPSGLDLFTMPSCPSRLSLTPPRPPTPELKPLAMDEWVPTLLLGISSFAPSKVRKSSSSATSRDDSSKMSATSDSASASSVAASNSSSSKQNSASTLPAISESSVGGNHSTNMSSAANNCRVAHEPLDCKIRNMEPYRDANGKVLDIFGRATLMAPADTAGFIATPSAMGSLVDHIVCFPPQKHPLLFMDAEGQNLGRNGTISMIQLIIQPTKEIFLIDVLTLKQLAFDTCGAVSGLSLRDILGSPNYSTAWWDARNDQNALFFLFGVRLCPTSTLDLQIMDAARSQVEHGGSIRVLKLGDALKKHVKLTDDEEKEFNIIKDHGKLLFRHEKYELYDERPLDIKLLKYCVYDVALLPELYHTLLAKIEAHPHAEYTKLNYQKVSGARIMDACTETYDPQPPFPFFFRKSDAPWALFSRFSEEDGEPIYTNARHEWIHSPDRLVELGEEKMQRRRAWEEKLKREWAAWLDGGGEERMPGFIDVPVLSVERVPEAFLGCRDGLEEGLEGSMTVWRWKGEGYRWRHRYTTKWYDFYQFRMSRNEGYWSVENWEGRGLGYEYWHGTSEVKEW